MDIKSHITCTPDWPSAGVNFLDIGGLLKTPTVFAKCVDQMCQHVRSSGASSLVAVDSRGFLFAGALGYQAQIPVYMARKIGKLPGPCVSQSYGTEYNRDIIELQESCELGAHPMIIDDLLATGGTVLAVAGLIRSRFAVESISALVAINLAFLPGVRELQKAGVDLRYLVEYDA